MVAESELLRLIDLIYQGALEAGCWADCRRRGEPSALKPPASTFTSARVSRRAIS